MRKKLKVAPPRGPNARIAPNASLETAPGDQQKFPVFCFKCLYPGYGVDECSAPEKRAFAQKLVKLGSLTWQQITESAPHANGFELLDPSFMKVPVPAHAQECRKLHVFRLKGVESRFIGYRDRERPRIFHVVWLDPNHDLF